MPLSKVDRVMQHAQLGKCALRCLRSPVLMNVAHDTAPDEDLGRCPLALVKQMSV